jgi:hypothetical protein
MQIDIERLSEAELIDLNHRIVARLRLLRQAQTHIEMMEFGIGERVMFQSSSQQTIVGTVTRFNRKTVTVVTHTGQPWNVSPRLLSRVIDAEPDSNRLDAIRSGKR